ncbi:MAG TPA: hypothetical protein VGI96_05840 [Streptosporangiaceae bacterium]|jgi:hypothetical protein
MTDPARRSSLDLQDIETRNRNARHIIVGFSRALPTLTEAWHYLAGALADTPRLLGEIFRQRADLAAVRLDRANLLAAIRATLAADRDGETDPLAYLRDELADRPADPGMHG